MKSLFFGADSSNAHHGQNEATEAETAESQHDPRDRDHPEREEIANIVTIGVGHQTIVLNLSVDAVDPHVADYEPDE